MTLKLAECVTERPEWLDADKVPTTQTASTNQTEVVQLSCRVRGKPAPSITWSKGDDVIVAASSDIYRIVDERQYRNDLYTWIVTSRLLLQGIVNYTYTVCYHTDKMMMIAVSKYSVVHPDFHKSQNRSVGGMV